MARTDGARAREARREMRIWACIVAIGLLRSMWNDGDIVERDDEVVRNEDEDGSWMCRGKSVLISYREAGICRHHTDCERGKDDRFIVGKRVIKAVNTKTTTFQWMECKW